MGDRATLQIKEERCGVEIYTHWGGQEALIKAMAGAIKRGADRVTDAPYFTRIVICELAKGVEMETTGIGVWTPGAMENEYKPFVFDVFEQKIHLGKLEFTPQEFLERYEKGGIAPQS